jgi:hypothetical protein
MPSLDRDELREIVADLVDDNGLVAVLNALWNCLEIDAARILTDQEREPYRRVLSLLDAAVKEFQE